jgi:hypothetical protein
MKLKKHEKPFTEYLLSVKPQLVSHIENVRATGKFHSLETRIAWDCYRAWEKATALKLDDSVCDSHIESLAKKCLRNIGIQF